MSNEVGKDTKYFEMFLFLKIYTLFSIFFVQFTPRRNGCSYTIHHASSSSQVTEFGPPKLCFFLWHCKHLRKSLHVKYGVHGKSICIRILKGWPGLLLLGDRAPGPPLVTGAPDANGW